MSKFPETSLEAFHALTPEKLSGDYAKIINCLTVIGIGTYEMISDYIGCIEPNIVSRRLKELETKQLIFKTGEKRLTKRNRNAFVYCLTNNMPIIENTQTNNQKTAELNTTAIVKQPSLFE